jgi:hypothetical protein
MFLRANLSPHLPATTGTLTRFVSLKVREIMHGGGNKRGRTLYHCSVNARKVKAAMRRSGQVEVSPGR